MRIGRKIAACTVAAAAATVGLAVTAPTASAAPAAGGTAPACIGRYVDGDPDGFTVLLENNCGKTMRVQVVVAYAPDSSCYTLSAGASKLYTYRGITGVYDRTAVC
ncbi:beta-Ig-H3/fasciclin [Streptomyces poonensis]|uniref:Beta-Ig-H3/fasciclin n=1 Tax=Streptomyces poonensis TaxID=68255 RepID=A0A918USK1_9ACTN|nr:beta-Ig-H3/fasciclin [Streptomyces poonensis]GGZ30312.1 hypothetical protein GCM10010365_58540 [Streptomyces poonensis]